VYFFIISLKFIDSIVAESASLKQIENFITLSDDIVKTDEDSVNKI